MHLDFDCTFGLSGLGYGLGAIATHGVAGMLLHFPSTRSLA